MSDSDSNLIPTGKTPLRSNDTSDLRVLPTVHDQTDSRQQKVHYRSVVKSRFIEVFFKGKGPIYVRKSRGLSVRLKKKSFV